MKSYHLAIFGTIFFFFACNETTVRKGSFEVHGVDVSHHQKRIDWEKVAAQGIHFAFIKATEGETFKDSFFCKNWAAIKAAGIKRGAYHFFRPTLSPHLQAENFIEMTELGHGDIVPVLDVEVTDGISSEQLRKRVDVWLSVVENHFRVKPILYTYQKFFNKHFAGHYTDYPIWIARYSSWRRPCLKGGQKWQFWQYGNNGRLEGIDGPVDFNVFAGTTDQLNDFCIARPMPLLDPNDESLVSNP